SFAICNPDAASVGKLTKEALESTGQWKEIKARAKVQKPTVNEVANDVKIGAVDAGIVWDTTAALYDAIDVVRVPVFDANAQKITLGVLASCKQPKAALHFARYLAARDRGLLTFTD